MKIRHTITLWVAGAGLVASLFLSLIAFLEMEEQPYKLIDSDLATTSTYLEKILSDRERPPDLGDDKVLAILGDRYWAKVYDRQDKLVYRSGLTTHVELPLRKRTDNHGYTVKAHVPRQRIFLHQDSTDAVAFRVREMKAGPYRIEVAKPMEALEEEVFDVAVALIGGFMASSFILIVLSYLVAGRIVKPIGIMNAMTKEINEKSLDTRLPLGESHDEIFELTNSLNRMFDRLQYSFTKQKEFLANASHELKTPLAMLRLFFDEMMQRQDLPEAVQQQIYSQNNVVLRMERLVKTLLELSVLELKGDLELEEFDLVVLCRSVLDDFSPLMNDRQLTLTAMLPTTLPMRADKDKIRRLLINILDNAVKYNVAPGLIKLELREEDDCLHLLLANTFHPLPPQELAKVFEQFYRLEKSRSLQHGGAGLGLAISKEIVRLHGGRIGMESGPGDWVHLRLTLPRRNGGESGHRFAPP